MIKVNTSSYVIITVTDAMVIQHQRQMMNEEELKAKLAELEETNKSLVESVGKLEKANTDLVSQRTELKEKIKANSGDEELKKELDAYKLQLEEVEADKEALVGDFTHKLASKDMVQQLSALGVKTHNADALNMVSDLILNDAKYEDGAFKFVTEDNTTRFNDSNKPFNLQDKVNELKESDKSYLFVPSNGGGATDTTTAPAPQQSDLNSILNAGLKY